MAQKIGILGGSFDPVHNGHVRIARSARSELQLELLLFVPNAISPLKSSGPSASFEHRLAMLRLAIEGLDGFEVSDIEGGRGGISYTVDTLRELHSDFPGAEFYLIVGADALDEFHLWRDHESIQALARLAYVERSGGKGSRSRVAALRIPMPQCDVSSTLIRDCLRDGEPIDSLVPPAVAKYIETNHLYGD